ncbi:MAG: zf-TFIIB domain-containing protein [Gemmatimonadota bacterium]|nr:MAG: zf-TFIIB domain-containing protein [Gemmatimonadota bacterium]
MTDLSPRLPCPTCLGVAMEKLKPVRDHELVLDYCRRCGGVWFDAGEVRALRQVRPKGLGGAVELRETAFRMPCHSCLTAMNRDAQQCPACGWKNLLNCPKCQQRMERMERDGLTLDACRSCRGVWFDNHELAQIWNMEMRRNLPTVRRTNGAVTVADYFLLDAFLWAPDLVFLSASGVAHGASAAAGAAADVAAGGLSGIADTAGGAVEATAEAAGGVFETIAEIIASLF